MATSIAVQQEALTRAVSSQSLSNYATIIRGFMAKGLRESEISPRENVFTYNAWKALGRQVKKGEHGVRCLTFIVQRNKRTGREEKRPWTTTVFHVSQTEALGTQYAPKPLKPLVNNYERHSDACTCPNCNEPDATPENVPYAGEDEASRESGLDDAIAAHIQPPVLSIEELHSELETSGAKFEHVKTDEVDYLLTTPEQPQPEVIPAPAPKDSAYDRAMRGETVSIMDIISDLQDKPKPAPKAFQLPKRLQSAVRSFQTKTVDF